MRVNMFDRHRRGRSALACTILLGVLAACGGGEPTPLASPAASADSREQSLSAKRSSSSSPSTSGTKATTGATTTIAQPANTEGRLLASNCFQCHGTLGLGGFDKIRGSEASEVREFLTKPASKEIMAAHAQGYTPEQLNKIISYLQQ